MSVLVNQTISDIRSGRDSWRVLLLTGAPAFAIAFGVALLRLTF